MHKGERKISSFRARKHKVQKFAELTFILAVSIINLTKEKGGRRMEEAMSTAPLMGQVDMIRASYEEFVQSVQDLGNKSKGHTAGNNKMGGSFLRWIAGSHVSTPRDLLCEQFLEKVEGQLVQFSALLEEAETGERSEACDALAELMLEVRPMKSNSTTDLMRRAMASRFTPYLPQLTTEALTKHTEAYKTAYRPRDLLPVEKTLLADLEKELKNRA